MGFFDLITDPFNSDNEEEAARQKAEGLRAGETKAYGALDAGYGTASGLYDKARVPFSDLYAKGSKGYDTYLDATGVNGAEGIGRAGDLYKSLPGYSAGQTMGLDMLERRAAARGDLGGGNTSADTIKFASDYDSTKYKDFLASLSGNAGVASSAAAGQGALYGSQAGMAGAIGSEKAKYGYGTEKGIGDANAEATMSAEKSSANFWGALMGAANLGLSAFGGGGGGGFSSLFGGGGGAADVMKVGSQSFPKFT
jgi:hypothetical protein